MSDGLTVSDLDDRAVISVPEAGELLDLSRSAAYRAANRGDIPVLRLGRRMIVPTARLREMLGLDDPEDDRQPAA